MYEQNGERSFLWQSEEDAQQFMLEYVKENGVTDLTNYRLYELAVTGVKQGESVMGFTEASQLLDDEEVESPARQLEP